MHKAWQIEEKQSEVNSAPNTPNDSAQDSKDELLKALEQSEQNLSPKSLLLVFLLFFIALILLLPKIYISNQIYYISRDISALQGQKDILVQERELLNLKIEKLRFEQQIAPLRSLK